MSCDDSSSLGSGIEIDPSVFEVGDGGSDYEPTGCDSSLSSTVNQYFFENGRRYHSYFGTDKNYMPTDEKEQDRLDLHHEVMLLLLDGQFHKAPIPSTCERILDIGTGTGIWAIDMAIKFPQAEVIGTDLSPIQLDWAPENCRFEVDNVEWEWVDHRSNSFDFIHARNLAQSITDWSMVMSEAFRCCKPGGYVELSELSTTMRSDDNTLKPDHGLKRCMDALEEALIKVGRPSATAELLKQRLENAGFVDIKQYVYKEPLGPWAKDPRLKRVGALVLMAADTGVEAYAMGCLTRVLGMDPMDAKRLCAEALRDARCKQYHTYNYFYVTYGRKPDIVEDAAQAMEDVKC